MLTVAFRVGRVRLFTKRMMNFEFQIRRKDEAAQPYKWFGLFSFYPNAVVLKSGMYFKKLQKLNIGNGF